MSKSSCRRTAVILYSLDIGLYTFPSSISRKANNSMTRVQTCFLQGAYDAMVIIIGNGYSDLSSNFGPSCLHVTYC